MTNQIQERLFFPRLVSNRNHKFFVSELLFLTIQISNYKECCTTGNLKKSSHKKLTNERDAPKTRIFDPKRSCRSSSFIELISPYAGADKITDPSGENRGQDPANSGTIFNNRFVLKSQTRDRYKYVTRGNFTPQLKIPNLGKLHFSRITTIECHLVIGWQTLEFTIWSTVQPQEGEHFHIILHVKCCSLMWSNPQPNVEL